MRYFNSVVIKLWLTIILIVTTVLILLSMALVGFFNSYLMSESGHNLKQQAEKVEQVLTSHHNQADALDYVKELIENPAGLIIIKDRKDLDTHYDDPLKQSIINEIKTNAEYKNVFTNDDYIVKDININYHEAKEEYILVGYPSQAFKSNEAGIFIYQDTSSISDAFRFITLIIFLVALLFILLTTIFAFFLSNRITKPLLQLKNAAFNLAKGEHNMKIPVYSRDEIGELALAFNKMETDITENVNNITHERNLRDRLINAMEDGVLSFNMDLASQLKNPMAEQFLNQIDQHEVEMLSQLVNDVIKNDETKYHEISNKNKHFVIIISPVTNPSENKQNGAVAIIRDMTEEKNVDMMKQQFIANVSHELRTPIQMLQGYTEAILDGIVEEKADIDEFLNIILDESKRLNRLVNELLNIARIDSGESVIHKTPVQVDELLDKVIQNFKQTTVENGIALTGEYQHRQKEYALDYDKMMQVMTNLIDNAVRYTHEGDSITIRTSNDAHHLNISVIDTGVGIEQEHIEKIFDRFYKVDQARTRGKHGTGLGLFIVKTIIESHGGTITVDSVKGNGTAFHIKIPIVDMD